MSLAETAAVRAHRRDHRPTHARRRVAGRDAAGALRGVGRRPAGEGQGEVRVARTSSRCRSASPWRRRSRRPCSEARRQGVDRRHLAGGVGRADVPRERPGDLGVLLRVRRSQWVARAKAGGAQRPGGRRDLRAGFLARGRRHRADVPRRARGHREVVRPHPSREPHQLGDRAAHVRRPGRLRRRSSATTCCGSTACAPSLVAGTPIAVTNTRTGASFKTTCVLTPRERDILLGRSARAHETLGPRQRRMERHEFDTASAGCARDGGGGRGRRRSCATTIGSGAAEP